MSELDEMRAFVEVVRAGGFSSAARRLGLAKSIVSRRISGLETALGVRLLDRTTRGVSPTAAGEEFAARAQAILTDVEEAHSIAAAAGNEVVGALRVSVPLSFGMRHVAPLLAELALQHPKLRIEAIYEDRRVDLIAERFDVAVRIGILNDSSLVARRIAPIHGMLVASPAYLEKHGWPKRPEDLPGHAFITRTAPYAGEPLRFRVGNRWVPVHVDGRFRADNGEAILQAAIAGLGIAAVPTFFAGDTFESGKLVPLLLDYSMPEAGLYVVRPPGQHVSGKVRALTDLVVERLGGEPYWDSCLMHRRRLGNDQVRIAERERVVGTAARSHPGVMASEAKQSIQSR